MNYQRESVRTFFYFCFTLAMLIPAAGSAAEDKMTAAEIRELLPSGTLSGRDKRQHQAHVYHDSTGVMEGKRAGRGVHFDFGKWTITNEGQYCQQWNRWLGRALVCFHIYRLGNNKYRIKSVTDQYDLRFKFREGDPERLKAN